MDKRIPGRHRRPGRLSTTTNTLTRSAAIAATSTGLIAGTAVSANAVPDIGQDPVSLVQNPSVPADALRRLVDAGMLTDRAAADRPARAVPAPSDLPVSFGTRGFTAVTLVVEPAAAVEQNIAQTQTAPQSQAATAAETRVQASASRDNERTSPAPQPAPQAAPQADPQPAPQAAQPAAQPAPQPAPQAAPQAAPQPAPQAAPQPAPQAAQPAAQPAPPPAPAPAPQPAPQPPPAPAPQPAPAPGGGGVLGVAASLTGLPYAHGGSSPSTGFDCSGFTSYVFAQVGVSLPRTAAGQQSYATPVSSPQPGDLVFFGWPAYHVGIYAGNGMMYDSGRPGIPTQYRAVFGGVSGYGRVL